MTALLFIFIVRRRKQRHFDFKLVWYYLRCRGGNKRDFAVSYVKQYTRGSQKVRAVGSPVSCTLGLSVLVLGATVAMWARAEAALPAADEWTVHKRVLPSPLLQSQLGLGTEYRWRIGTGSYMTGIYHAVKATPIMVLPFGVWADWKTLLTLLWMTPPSQQITI